MVVERQVGHQAADQRDRVAVVAGDEVRHAAFGDGVVTGVEGGGVVVVRFSGNAGERKLMAEYAPLTRR